MRTDLKIGLICAFAVVLGVVIYFVAKGNARPTPTRADTGTVTTRVTSPDPARNTGPASVTNPILTERSVAAATGTPVGGDYIREPRAATMPATTLPATTLPAVFSMDPRPGVTPLLPTPTTRPEPSLVFGAPVGTAATTYKIQKGDMLGTIAKKYNVTVKAIEAANPGIDSTRLKIDALINIPASTGTAAVTTRPASPLTTATPPATPSVLATTIKPGSTYKVKKGDSLASIAKAAYGSTTGWRKIFQANRAALSDPDLVPVGASIVIPQQ